MKKLSFLKVGLLILLASFVNCAAADPIQFIGSQGANEHYYDVIPKQNGISRDDANAEAENSDYKGLKGHLVTITSADEQQFIEKNLSGGFINQLNEILKI